VLTMKGLKGSSRLCREACPFETKVSEPIARFTVSGCTLSSAAIVPTFQCSAKKSLRIRVRCSTLLVIESLPRRS
jgi:hypothetical protein